MPPGPRQRETWQVLLGTIFRDGISERASLKLRPKAPVPICEGEIYSRRKMTIYRTGYGEHIAHRTVTQETSHIKRIVRDSESKGVY